MPETKDPTPETVRPEASAPEALAPQKNREPLFGTLLFVVLFLIVLASLGGIGFGAYRMWHTAQKESDEPSISGLQEVTIEEPTLDTQSAEKSSDGAVSEDAKKSAQSTDVSVLNGGAPAGTAGKAADALKKAGYTKLSTGSTTGDFTGNTIYFAPGKDQEAAALKEDLSQDYEDVAVKPQDSGEKETQGSPLVVILGASK
jgi:hypothetical protein